LGIGKWATPISSSRVISFRWITPGAGDVRGQVAGGSDGVFYPVLTDQIGSPRVVLDPSSGASRWEWEAKEVFGYQAPNENPGSVGVFKFDARFPGQWFDAETGLFQNGYRDYDPRTGRYVQSDPIGLGGGWNTYAYVGGDPSGAHDPLGLSQRDVDLFVAQFHKTVERMTKEGSRIPDGALNNRYGKWEDTWMGAVFDSNPLAKWRHLGKDGTGYEVCSGQTRILASDLFPLLVGKIKTDDIWKSKNPWNGHHYWIELRSSNPSDPVIWMDPWDDNISIGKPCPKCNGVAK
jgi:RHS repeat-associated protein